MSALRVLVIAAGMVHAGLAGAMSLDQLYLGLRGGFAQASIGGASLTYRLRQQGYADAQAAVATHDFGASAYAGYRLSDIAAVELGYVRLGHFDAVAATTTTEVTRFAAAVASQEQRAGQGASLAFRISRPNMLGPVTGDLRVGGYWSRQAFDDSVNGQHFSVARAGWGWLLAPGLSIRLIGPLWAGFNFEAYLPVGSRPTVEETAELEWRLE